MGGGSSKTGPHLQLIGKNFYNIRAEFKLFAGLLNIGTHMSVVKLSNDKFLVIDTVELVPSLKAELDQLTNNGADIEAVIATHPFHTLAFPGFHAAYPNVPYYGTPRHLRVQPQIPWKDDITNHLDAWKPDIELRIPAGAEWVAPVPESSNHFVSIWAYSPVARTVHVDDSIMCLHGVPSPVLTLMGKKTDQLTFHPSMTGPGLHHTAEAPIDFIQWLKQLLNDWDFDNICCAHLGVKLGGAKADVIDLLNNEESDLRKLAAKNAKRIAKAKPPKHGDVHDCSKYNVDGNECG